MSRRRARRSFRIYENEGTEGRRNGVGLEVTRVLECIGTQTNKVGLRCKLRGDPGTPFVKAKGPENGDSPPKMFSAAAVTVY